MRPSKRNFRGAAGTGPAHEPSSAIAEQLWEGTGVGVCPLFLLQSPTASHRPAERISAGSHPPCSDPVAREEYGGLELLLRHQPCFFCHRVFSGFFFLFKTTSVQPNPVHSCEPWLCGLHPCSFWLHTVSSVVVTSALVSSLSKELK